MNHYKFLSSLTRRTAIGKFFLLCVLLVFTFIAVNANLHHLKDYKNGYESFDPVTSSASDIIEKKFYEIELNEDYFYFDTAYYIGEEVQEYYFGTVLDDQILVLAIDGDHDFEMNQAILGHFETIEKDLETTLIEELETTYPGETFSIATLVFNQGKEASKGHMIYIISIIFALIIADLVVLIKLIRSFKFATSSLYKRMKSIGDPNAIADEIEKEFEMEKSTSIGPVYLFQKYIIIATTGSVKIIEKEDLIWCYLKITSHKKYFITTSKSYQILFNTASGQTFAATTTKKDHLKMMNTIAKYHKSCIYGFSDDLVKLYKDNKEAFTQAATKVTEDQIG